MSDTAHILVVDDDARLRQLIKNFLSREGYRVTASSSAGAAREMMEGLTFDALVLDVMMPGESGLDFLRALRESGGAVPVLILSALSEAKDRIAGLAGGSDDYLAKPFEPEELLLRLQGLLRRMQQKLAAEQQVSFGPFSFNVQLGELKRQGTPVRLTTSERDVLRILVKGAGNPMSRDKLAGGGSVEATRKIDVMVTRLRQKIEDDPSTPRYLQTVRGQGYALITGH